MGAPFAFRGLLLGIILVVAGIQDSRAAGCPASHVDEHVQAAYVFDGDTLRLKDGRRVRLIGINTPELNQKEAAPSPFAIEARDTLQDLLDSGGHTLLLQYGPERRDHYGRLLAHAFLENGANIAAHLLLQGLATTLVVPPNTWARGCYQDLEDRARGAGRGLWGLADYRAMDARTLPLKTRGFRIVRGRVSEVRESRHNIWVDIDGPLVVRVSRKDSQYFEPDYLEQLPGQEVELRGWIKQDREGLRLTARHPAAIDMIARSLEE